MKESIKHSIFKAQSYEDNPCREIIPRKHSIFYKRAYDSNTCTEIMTTPKNQQIVSYVSPESTMIQASLKAKNLLNTAPRFVRLISSLAVVIEPLYSEFAPPEVSLGNNPAQENMLNAQSGSILAIFLVGACCADAAAMSAHASQLALLTNVLAIFSSRIPEENFIDHSIRHLTNSIYRGAPHFRGATANEIIAELFPTFENRKHQEDKANDESVTFIFNRGPKA